VKTSTLVLTGWLLAGIVTGLARTPSWGCAPAPPPGYHVSILKEFALIVWDPTAKIEHFIRVADFHTDAPEMGFLVPTPTVPELFEVDADAIAAQLRQTTAARRVVKRSILTKFGLGPWESVGTIFTDTAATPLPGGVDVLAQYEVAGYEASVLRADDPQRLKTWLTDHGYTTSNAIESWLKVYTDQKWIITAFKVSESAEIGTLKTHAVRMTFASEQPFYPYREPPPEELAAERAKLPSDTRRSRLLRVFLLADQRYEATIGREQKWHAKTVFSNSVQSYVAQSVARSLSLQKVPAYLTEFEDQAAPRPGFDELYFHVAEQQGTVERPPIIVRRTQIEYYPGWRGAFWLAGLLLPLSVVVGGGWYWFRQRPGNGPV